MAKVKSDKRDWVDVLVVPAALLIVGAVFTFSQGLRQQSIEDQRARQEALQAYLDQMGALLLEEDLRDSKAGSEERLIARARTLTVLGQLPSDPRREDSEKERAIEFLVEAKLITSSDGEDPIVSLEETDLGGVDLDFEDLHGVTLKNAVLREANLEGANLKDADLRGAKLRDANLEDADLRGAKLNEAELREADLEGADVGDARLENAKLGAATMPDGSRHPCQRAQDVQVYSGHLRPYISDC